jgi:hypothetical protein
MRKKTNLRTEYTRYFPYIKKKVPQMRDLLKIQLLIEIISM